MALVIVCALFCGCAGGRRREQVGPPRIPRLELPPDSLYHFKGFGTLALAYRGERHRVKIDVINDAHSSFESSLFGPFGGLIAWLSAGSDSVTIEAGTQVRRIARSDSLAKGIWLLRGYPFTFDDFARIVSGRLYDPGILDRVPDSVVEQGWETCFFWQSDSMRVGAEVGGWRRELEEVRYDSCGGWSLSYRRFRSDVATEIHFELDPMNYFTLTYDKVWLGRQGPGRRIK
jgi:hypothetical protein